MILLLAGTSEGKECLQALINANYQVLVSVTSETGAQVLKDIEPKANYTLNVGKLDNIQMFELAKREAISLVVDATHPHALEVKKNIANVVKELGIPLVRFNRQQEECMYHKQIRVSDFESAAQKAIDITNVSESIFLAIGANNLHRVVPIIKNSKRRVVARILPTSDSICKAQESGLETSQIIAMQGHGSLELNAALFKQYNTAVVITKDSGTKGGFGVKVKAASLLEIPIVVIDRPIDCQPDTYQFWQVNQLIDFIIMKGWVK